jgi:hypothetical protein
MVDASTHDRGQLVRQILLVLAVVMVLMTAAAPAGASRLTGSVGTANSARTAAIDKQHAHARQHPFLRWRVCSRRGRKVG